MTAKRTLSSTSLRLFGLSQQSGSQIHANSTQFVVTNITKQSQLDSSGDCFTAFAMAKLDSWAYLLQRLELDKTQTVFYWFSVQFDMNSHKSF